MSEDSVGYVTDRDSYIECRTKEMTVNQIINRHKARILSNLEEVNCPLVYKDAVISGLNWLRSDINENERNGAHNEHEITGNK